MKPSECGFATPPADGTRNREIMDRFADFLRAAGPPAPTARSGVIAHGRRRTPAERYRVKFLMWRVGQVPK
jgi:hypothetical protein